MYCLWIVLLILPCSSVTSKPVDYETNAQVQQIPTVNSDSKFLADAQNIPKQSTSDGEIISVRITSSIAVDRGKIKHFEDANRYDSSSHKQNGYEVYNPSTVDVGETTVATEFADFTTVPTTGAEVNEHTDAPPGFEGANMEYIKQLQAKKGQRGVNKFEGNHYRPENEENDNVANESEIKPSIDLNRSDEENDDVPLARSVPLSYSSRRYLQDSTQRSQGAYKLTTVNFNVVHDVNDANPSEPTGYVSDNRASNLQTFYSEPAKVYSKPAQVYSEPAKFYSEPSKIYSEPAKIYSEPAKIYSEPAKIYSEPAKFYSEPASLHLESRQRSPAWKPSSGFHRATTPGTLSSTVEAQKVPEHQPEKNYEVDEKVSVMTDGRSHGVQQNPDNCKQENCKVGYVVEGRQFRKYRVEERTPDGFIVGEYGVVRNEDGALRGVRYTADSEASPSLIHDALMKFLQLK
ncbi:uncharacterized protein LOC121735313 [Aricia agestis]|uniref:uncharacterized protein LOC121735313 n=1 Tax=Aricia agestis TaxID=91739 RepID=UPI001C20ADD0|nr:uncharacterized protein LOC121735313 [Aricia agestis]